MGTVMREFLIENEGYTVACLLRSQLVEVSTFAACTVKHPDDTCLSIQIDSPTPVDHVLETVVTMQTLLGSLMQQVNGLSINKLVG